MDKKQIKKYAANGILTATLIAGIGLGIHESSIDHTEKVCPITKILNIIPNFSDLKYGLYLPTGVAIHQWPEMEKDFAKKGIEDVTISYGMQTEKVTEILYTAPTTIVKSNGEITYVAPEGYILTLDEDGNPICRKEVVTTKDTGIGLKATWGRLYYDNNNEFIFENENVLKIKK